MFILVGREESRSKVLAVIAVTYELGPPDIAKTPEGRATAACGMGSKGRAATEHEHRCQEIASLNFL